MATLTKSFTENEFNDYKSVWTFTATANDVTVSESTFTFPVPTMTAKYVFSGKKMAQAVINAYYKINNTNRQVFSWYRGTGPWGIGTAIATTSGTVYTLTNDSTLTTYNTSTFFNSNNPTVRSIPIELYTGSSGIAMLSYRNNDSDYYNGYQGNAAFSWGTIGNLILNAPPVVTVGTPTYSTPQYANLGSYSVPITSASAKYGGTISEVTLTIGNDSTTQTYSSTTISNKTISVVPTVPGTYTPTLTVTDSRGQVTTTTFSSITVNAYTSPSLNVDVFRSDNAGVKDDEGTYGLITADVTFTSAVATITQPTVTIDGITTNNVTWYSTYNSSTGVSSAISDWTTVDTCDTIYGLVNGSFSGSQSYIIGVTVTDSEGGTSATITQTLSTAFYTIDFQAGGKEIAFGGPANDNLSSHPNGLFRCDMDAEFNGNVSGVGGGLIGEIKMYAGATVPNGWLECDGTEVAISDYPTLYAAIGSLWGTASDQDHFVLPDLQGRVPVGYDSTDTDFDNVGESGGAKTVTLDDTMIPAHTHGEKSLTGTAAFRGWSSGTPIVSVSGIFSTSTNSSKGQNIATNSNSYNYRNLTVTATHTHNSVGGGQAHNNVQPYAVVKYIICAA